MSLASARAFLKEKAPDIEIIECNQSTATVELAAKAHQVEAGQIAKTLAFKIKDNTVLVVAKGDARVDNKKLKQTFGGKAKMLDAETVLALTGHPVGGVCPFGLMTPLPVYCDISLKQYAEVLPAAGDVHTALRISPTRLAEITNAGWVDVCQSS